MVVDARALTPEEVAERLRVDVRTVHQWLREGDLRGFKLPGGRHWRIPIEEVERIERGTVSDPES